VLRIQMKRKEKEREQNDIRLDKIVLSKVDDKHEHKHSIVKIF
jgi:hypothetical protein